MSYSITSENPARDGQGPSLVKRKAAEWVDGWDMLFGGMRSKPYTVLCLTLTLMDFLFTFLMISRTNLAIGPFGVFNLFYMDCGSSGISAFAQKSCDAAPVGGFVWELLAHTLNMSLSIPGLCYINSPGGSKLWGFLLFALIAGSRCFLMARGVSELVHEDDVNFSTFGYVVSLIAGYMILSALAVKILFMPDSASHKYRIMQRAKRHTRSLLRSEEVDRRLPAAYQRICEVLSEVIDSSRLTNSSSVAAAQQAVHEGKRKTPVHTKYPGFVKMQFERTVLRRQVQIHRHEPLPVLSLVAASLSLVLVSFLFGFTLETGWHYLDLGNDLGKEVRNYQNIATDITYQLNSTVESAWDVWHQVLHIEGRAHHALASVAQAQDLLRPLVDELTVQNPAAATSIEQALVTLDAVSVGRLEQARPLLETTLQDITAQLAKMRGETQSIASNLSSFLSVTRWLSDVLNRSLDYFSVSLGIGSVVAFIFSLVSLHFNVWRILEDKSEFTRGRKHVTADEAATIFHPVRAGGLPGVMLSSTIFGFMVMFGIVFCFIAGSVLSIEVLLAYGEFGLNLLTFVSGTGLSVLVKVLVLDRFIGRRLLTEDGFILDWKGFNNYLLWTIPISTASGLILAATRLAMLMAIGAFYILRLDTTLFPEALSGFDPGYSSYVAAMLVNHRHQNKIWQALAQEFTHACSNESLARRRVINKWNLGVTLVNNPSLIHERRCGKQEELDEEHSQMQEESASQSSTEAKPEEIGAYADHVTSVLPTLPNMPDEEQ